LGNGPQPDLLAVSLSATDAVGHRYGMDSREMHDQILRLDRSLGTFLDSLYKLRDSSRVVIALTADHGMAPYPELHFAGSDPMRGKAQISPVLAAFRQSLVDHKVPLDAFDFESGVLLLDREPLRRAGLNADSALSALLAQVRKVKGVQRVYLPNELAPLAAKGDKYARRWLHMVPPDLDAAAFVTLQPYWYYAPGTYATHGSPHDYDTRVPVIFYGAPFRPGKYGAFTRVVDLAPTLAAVLGVAPTEPLDGVVLQAALKPASSAAPKPAPVRR
jgi:arylsulfatase A-like enzyme